VTFYVTSPKATESYFQKFVRRMLINNILDLLRQNQEVMYRDAKDRQLMKVLGS